MFLNWTICLWPVSVVTIGSDTATDRVARCEVTKKHTHVFVVFAQDDVDQGWPNWNLKLDYRPTALSCIIKMYNGAIQVPSGQVRKKI